MKVNFMKWNHNHNVLVGIAAIFVSVGLLAYCGQTQSIAPNTTVQKVKSNSVPLGEHCEYSGQCIGQDNYCSGNICSAPPLAPVMNVLPGGQCEHDGQCAGAFICTENKCTRPICGEITDPAWMHYDSSESDEPQNIATMKSWTKECREKALHESCDGDTCLPGLINSLIKASPMEDRAAYHKEFDPLIRKFNAMVAARQKEQDAIVAREEAREQAHKRFCSARNIQNTCCRKACNGDTTIGECLRSFANDGCDGLEGSSLSCSCY